jgi:hypothetical protein
MRIIETALDKYALLEEGVLYYSPVYTHDPVWPFPLRLCN